MSPAFWKEGAQLFFFGFVFAQHGPCQTGARVAQTCPTTSFFPPPGDCGHIELVERLVAAKAVAGEEARRSFATGALSEVS